MSIKKLLLFRIAVVLSILQLMGIAAYGKETGDDDFLLPVIHTSDIHGHLVNTSVSDNQCRIAYIYDRLLDHRGRGGTYDKSRALLLDSGDVFQGSYLSFSYSGEPLSAVFDMMGYDAVTIGNHEFDWGLGTLADPDGTMRDYSIEGADIENDIPFVACNLYRNGEKTVFCSDYVILEKTAVNCMGETKTVRIGVIGFEEDYERSVKKSEFGDRGFSIDEDFSIINSLACDLEEKGLCDATIMLSHGDAGDMAKGLGGSSVIDLVLGGHSHYNACARSEAGIPYMQPAAYARAFDSAMLAFYTDDEGKVRFRDVIGAVNNIVPDAGDSCYDDLATKEQVGELVDYIKTCASTVASLMSRKLGYIVSSAEKGVYLPDSGDRCDLAGNWMASIMARATASDVSFINRGGIRIGFSIPEGTTERDITVGDVYDMFPYGNNLYKYRISYEDFLHLLQYSLTREGLGLFTNMVGAKCYFTGSTVNAIERDGILIYKNGVFREGWKDKTLTLVVQAFSATGKRTDTETGLSNPLVEWNETDRLMDTSSVDNESAVELLTAEGEENDGLLSLDKDIHFILGEYDKDQSIDDKGSSSSSDKENASSLDKESASSTTESGSSSDHKDGSSSAQKDGLSTSSASKTSSSSSDKDGSSVTDKDSSSSADDHRFAVVKQCIDIKPAFEKTYIRYRVLEKGAAKVNKAGILKVKKAGTITVAGLVKKDGKWEPDMGSVLRIEAEKPCFREKKAELTISGEFYDAAQNLMGVTGTMTEWVSSKPEVVSIDPVTGQCRALKKGAARITAVFGRDRMAAKYSFRIRVRQ